jgi:hypothetical protein
MKMKIDENAEGTASSDPLYDLFEGGYLNPHKFLEYDRDIIDVEVAMRVINRYLDALKEAGKLEII